MRGAVKCTANTTVGKEMKGLFPRMLFSGAYQLPWGSRSRYHPSESRTYMPYMKVYSCSKSWVWLCSYGTRKKCVFSTKNNIHNEYNTFCLIVLSFETGFLSAPLVVLELTLQTRVTLNSEIHLPLPLKCWD